MDNSASLTKNLRQLIADPTNTIFVSSVAVWEITIKVGLGKLRLPLDFQEKLAKEPFENLPLTAAHAHALAELPGIHREPFGRMLVAQAQVEGFRLLTADRQLEAYGTAVLSAN